MRHIRVQGYEHYDAPNGWWRAHLGRRTKSDGRTMCGAAPTDDDLGRKWATELLRASAPQPDTAPNRICPACALVLGVERKTTEDE